jgi:multisubunit Na+/H+ antiporter MnhC subunit
MPLELCGLISAALFVLGLFAAGSRRFAHRRAIGLGLMLQAGLLLIVSAARQLGQIDGYAVALLGVGLLPLICLPERPGRSETKRPEKSAPPRTDRREAP